MEQKAIFISGSSLDQDLEMSNTISVNKLFPFHFIKPALKNNFYKLFHSY